MARSRSPSLILLLLLAVVTALLLSTVLWTSPVEAAKAKGKPAKGATSSSSKSSSNNSQFRLTLSEVTVEVNNPKDKARTQQEALTYPASFAKPLVVQPGDQLNIAFVLMKAPADATEAAKGVRAHQSFIVFRPQPATDAQAHLGPLVQSFQSTTSGKHRVNLIAGRFSRYFSRQPGAYDVELILGVFGAVTPIRYRLGTIDFDFPLADPTDPAVVDDEAKRAKQRALEGPPDAEYEALPEIVHQFRPAEHMPPVLFSLGYSAVVLLPWPILLALWKWIGIKPTQWPKTPAMLVTHGLFFGGISGFILLYAAYWIKLRLLQTLAYALPLAIFTALVGRVALSDVAHRRVQATKSE